MVRKTATTVLASLVLSAWAGNTFYWHGGGAWSLWSDAGCWSVSPDSYSNPSSLIPGGSPDDKVDYQGYTYSGDWGTLGYFDLGGGDHTIESLAWEGKTISPAWKSYLMHLTNGTLRITSQTNTHAQIGFGFEIYDGGVLHLGEPTSPGCLYRNLGMYSYWNVRSGGRMEVRASGLRLAAISSTISAGGTLVFDPEKFSVHNSADLTRICKIENHGTLIAPRGLLWNGVDTYTSKRNNIFQQKKMHVYQKAGSTTYLCGDFAKTTEEAKTEDSGGCQCDFRFIMEGGTLVTSNSVAFANRTSRYGTETFADMTGSATVRTEIGSVLDMGLFTYSDGVTLTKDGPGTLKLKSMPPALVVLAGSVHFSEPVTNVSSASFGSGVEIVFGTTGNAFSAPSNYADLDFRIADSGFLHSSVDLLVSDNAGFLSHVLAKISVNMPADKEARIEGNAIRLLPNASATFFWRASPRSWAEWGDPANWSLSVSSSANVGNLIPGAPGVENRIFARSVEAHESDYGNYYGKFDLGGGCYTLSGFSVGNGEAGLNWHSPQFHLTNGTLTVTDTGMPLASLAMSYIVWDGATLNYTGKGASDLVGCSGLYEVWNVKQGGRFNLLGSIYAVTLKATVEAGGTFSWPEGRFLISRTMEQERPFTIDNYGTFELTNGLQWVEGDSTTFGSKRFIFNQLGGTVHFGGDFAKTAEESNNASAGGSMSFVFSGGMLTATNDVAFANRTMRFGRETFASVPDDASVSVRVLGADSRLDMRLFTFGSGTAVSKDGEGLLVLADLPSSLTVSDGAVGFGAPVDGSTALTLADGVHVVLGAAGHAFTPPVNYTKLSFSLDTEAFVMGDVILSSSNGEFLEYVKDEIEGSGTKPQDANIEITDGSLKLVASGANVFSGEGEFDLDDKDRWSGGSVPSGAPVIISGATTVARISSGSPVFESITLADGATLKMMDGADVPPVTLLYPSTLSVAEGATAVLTNGISSFGDANGLPVISIATGGVLTVSAETVFKNVDIRLCGTVTTDREGRLTFGGASAGEVSYFSMTSVGGEIRTIGGPNVGGSLSGAYRRFAVPEKGGAVIVQGTLLFTDTTFSTVDPDTGKLGYSGTAIGYGNNSTYPFEMVIDSSNVNLMRGIYLGASALLRIVNGSVVRLGAIHPGVATLMEVRHNARISVEGQGAMLLLENADPFQNQFQPDVKGTESLVIKDGGLVAVHNTEGSGSACARIEDGVMAIPNLPYLPSDKNPCPENEDVRNWMSDLFTGFRDIHVPEGRSLFISSADLMGSPNSIAPVQWDRDMKIANIPITGGGDVVLTNGTPGYALSVTVVNGANTCTGRIYSDLRASDPTVFRFADGANWAGTVVGNAGISLTNLTDAAAPANVSFAALELDGTMPFRVWRDGTSDTMDLGSAISGNGKLKPVFMDGEPTAEVTYTLGRYPASAAVPDGSFAWRGCRFFVEPIDGAEDQVMLKMVWHKVGTVVTFR